MRLGATLGRLFVRSPNPEAAQKPSVLAGCIRHRSFARRITNPGESDETNEPNKIEGFLSFIRNGTVKEEQWNSIIETATSLTWKMEPEDISQTFKLYCNEPRNRKLLNRLLGCVSNNLKEFSFPDLLSIINSCAKLDILSNHIVNQLVDELCDIITESASTVDSNFPFNFPIGSDDDEISRTETLPSVHLVEAMRLLSKCEVLHTRFWDVSTSALTVSFISTMPPAHLTSILESCAHIDLRIARVLQNICTVLFESSLLRQIPNVEVGTRKAQHDSLIASTTGYDGVSWSLLVRIITALDRLSYWPDVKAQLDHKAKVYISLIDENPTKATVENIIKILYSFCCVRETFEPKVVAKCLSILTTQEIPAAITHQLLCVVDFLNTERVMKSDNEDLAKLSNELIVNVKRKHQLSSTDQEHSVRKSFNTFELEYILKEMRIQTKPSELNFGEHCLLFKHSLQDSKTIIMYVNTNNFYINTTQLNSTTRTLQRYVEASGIRVVSISYFQWSTLKTRVEKKRFLLTRLKDSQ